MAKGIDITTAKVDPFWEEVNSIQSGLVIVGWSQKAVGGHLDCCVILRKIASKLSVGRLITWKQQRGKTGMQICLDGMNRRMYINKLYHLEDDNIA